MKGKKPKHAPNSSRDGEAAAPESHAGDDPTNKPQTATAMSGAKLRQTRESRGITLKEVAERTKINVAILAALEEERFDDMPNARVYVRGFVRCLAKEIGLDEDIVTRSYIPRWESWQQSRS
ncbi:MAG: helix-turn-helix domain-containing protein [Deltaproteobacteria bacterium]|nr:helix-turn-helix domain-containing protein [Deltaproteobacteria bacterium]